MSKLWTRLVRRTAFSFAATRARLVPHPNKRVNRTVQPLRCPRRVAPRQPVTRIVRLIGGLRRNDASRSL